MEPTGEAMEVWERLPDDLSMERRMVVTYALALVDKVDYFWGGKSLVLGWDDRWGELMEVTAEGSDTTGSTTGSTTGNTTATVDVSKLTITATSEGGYEGDLASTSETGVFEMSAKAGEVWTLGLKGTDASVTWAMDGDSNGVCKLEGAKVTVTGTSSGRYATIVGTVGGGTVKAIIRIR